MKNFTASFQRGQFSSKVENRSRNLLFVLTFLNMNTVHDIILSDRHIGLNQLSEALNISHRCVNHRVQVELDKRKISAK